MILTTSNCASELKILLHNSQVNVMILLVDLGISGLFDEVTRLGPSCESSSSFQPPEYQCAIKGYLYTTTGL